MTNDPKTGEVGPSVVLGRTISGEKLAAARAFRREATRTEQRAWELLRGRRTLGLKFRRQQLIRGFIADFFCAEHRLVLEIDGGVHRLVSTEAYDRERSGVFGALGIHVVRIANEEVTDPKLREMLGAFLAGRSPS